MLPLLLPLLAAPSGVDDAALARIHSRCAARLGALHEAGSFPGGSAALVLPDRSVVAVAVGRASVVEGDALEPKDRMLSGSAGKTYVSACALRLATAGELDLDARGDVLPRGGRGVVRAVAEQRRFHRAPTPRSRFRPCSSWATIAREELAR